MNQANRRNLTDTRRYLVTGAAGFIGSHTARRLLSCGHEVLTLDNLNSYYDTSLKRARLELLLADGAQFVQMDLCDADALYQQFRSYQPEIVIHLAAQAGVRYSMKNPISYINSNVVAFANVLEACKKYVPSHLVYASSSSVYGEINPLPFREDDDTSHPTSLYAATKKSNEVLAHSYSHVYDIPCTGLRLFTVYGPWGRPDMAYYSFVNAFFNGTTIDVHRLPGHDILRSFTYIDDAAEAVIRLSLKGPTGMDPHRIVNVASSKLVALEEFVSVLETELSDSLSRPVSFQKRYTQPTRADVRATHADTHRLRGLIGDTRETDLREGLRQFIKWYLEYHITRSPLYGGPPSVPHRIN